MPLVGEELAGYRLEEVLGRGGMGTVFLAEHVALGRKAALKIMNVSLAADERFRERFKREARLAASLDHPNIVPVYDAGQSGDHLFIAMRYVRGTDLAAYIREAGRVEPRVVAAIVTQIGSALDAAHRRGLVHRDVKPANVLLAKDPDDPDGPLHAFLTDFGITRKVESTANLTATGAFVGSVQSAAPEQISGGATTPATDIYALGCLAYESLTGEPPFRRDHDVATLWAHLNDPVTPVSGTVKGVSTEIDVAVGRALAKDPAARWPTCASFASAFQAGLAPERDTLVEEPQLQAPPTPPTAGDPTLPAGDPTLPADVETVEDRRRGASDSAQRERAARAAARRAAEEAEAERAEAEREEAERAEAERLAAERAEAERAEAERLAAERAEAERLAAERAEAERAEAERAAAERAEAERLAAERAEAARVEAERLAAERAEAERLAAERAEAERLAAERAEAERAEAERAEAERAEAERAEAERAEAERAEAKWVAAERAEAERAEAERAEAERAARDRRAAVEAARAAAAKARAERKAKRAKDEAATGKAVAGRGGRGPVLRALAAAGVVTLAVVAGRAVGGDEEPPPAPRPIEVSSPRLSLTLPAGAAEVAAPDLPSIGPLELKAPVVAADVDGADVRAGALQAPRAGLDPLPKALSGTQALVTLPAGQARRYDAEVDGRPVRLFALATGPADWTVLACGGGSATTCDAAAAGLRLKAGEALPLAPDTAFAAALQRARSALAKVRRRETPRLRDGSRGRRENAARTLATAHRAAAAALDDLKAPVLVAAAVRAERTALRALAATFTSLANAAAGNRRRAFDRGRERLLRNDAALAAAQSRFEAFGYGS